MKVIELLERIANNEDIPDQIYYNGKWFYYEDNEFIDKKYGISLINYFLFEELNEDIDVIYNKEDKKIEKLDFEDFIEDGKGINVNTHRIITKINEIIDKMNKDE